LALPLYVILVVFKKELRPNLRNIFNLAVIGFAVVFWVSGLLGVNPHRSLLGNFERMGGAFYIMHLALLYFFILLLSQAGGVYIKRILKFFLFIAGIICVNGVVGWLGGPTLVLDPSLPGRASSTLGNPIYFGAFAILPIFLSLFFAFRTETKLGQILYALSASIFFVAMFQSGTRGALVGFLSGVILASIVYLFFHPSLKIRRNGLIVVAVGGIIFGSLFFKPEVLPQGSAFRRIFQLKDSNTSARVIQWQSALSGVKDFPIFGTGPENYYFISNQYYNPEMYQYDRSWFDKPHNYLLEVLSTAGLVGLGFYLVILVWVVKILHRAFKQEFLSLREFCVLLAGFIAYQVQNLFVFDTVPTSVAFFVFLGFIAYLAYEMQFSVSKKSYQSVNFSSSLFIVILLLASCLSGYAVWFLNILPMQAAKNVNYGYAYMNVNPVKAKAYFNLAFNNQFNFDIAESSAKLNEFAQMALVTLSQNPQYKQEFIDSIVQESIEWSEYAVKLSHATSPIVAKQ
jgi:O-antigen ligase